MKLASIIFLMFSLLSFNSNSQGTFLWAKGVGGTNKDIGKAIATDASGNVYSTGYFQGTVDFDAGPGTYTLTTAGQDVFVMKYDISGNFIWAKQIGGGFFGNCSGNGIAVDASGNAYLTGVFTSTVDFDPGPGTFTIATMGGEDIFITKLDGSGNFVWAKSFGGPAGAGSDAGNAIALDGTANVYATGSYSGTVDFDPGTGVTNLTSLGGSSDIFISKLDAAGNFVWAKSMGGSGSDASLGITVDGTGNVHTTGYYRSTVDFDPGASVSNLIATSIYDNMFISKLTSAGNFVWAKHIGGNFWCYGYSIAVDGSGNVYTTGDFYANVDFDPGATSYSITSTPGGADNTFVSKLNSSGSFVWAKNFTSSASCWGASIAIDAASNAYITGNFSGTGDFDPGAAVYNLTSPGGVPDIFVVNLSFAGNFVWAKRLGGTGYDYGNAIALDAVGDIYLTGYFNGTADFDPGAPVYNLVSKGNEDIFVSKLSGNGGVGLKEVNNSFFTLYPNPTTGIINLKIDLQKEGTSIEVYNGLGQLIKEQIMNAQSYTLDLSNEASAIYYLKVRTGNQIQVIKLIKN